MSQSDEVDSKLDIIHNLRTLKYYEITNTQYHKEMMTQGGNFVALKQPNESYLFGNCKFLGFKNNTAADAEARAKARPRRVGAADCQI
jgi:hypothetical protein